MGLLSKEMRGYLTELFGAPFWAITAFTLLLGWGAYFLVEHFYRWGGWNWLDFLGHEYLGVLLVGIGLIGFSYLIKKRWILWKK